jgi:transposase
MNYYAALDVSLRSVHLCVIDDQGELITETKPSSEVAAYLDALELEVSVVGLEAGTSAQYLTYGLQSAGFEMMVCSYYFLLLIKFLTCYRSLRKHEARR